MTTTSQQYKPFGTYHFILGKVTACRCLLDCGPNVCPTAMHHVFELHIAAVFFMSCQSSNLDSLPANRNFDRPTHSSNQTYASLLADQACFERCRKCGRRAMAAQHPQAASAMPTTPKR